MNSITIDYRSTDGKSPTSVRLLHNPLDFIAEDNLRLRAMCAEMDRLADGSGDTTTVVAELTGYLSHEMPYLLSDEDDDLMPRLLTRAEADDEIPKLAKRLQNDHAKINALLDEVRSGLAQVLDGVGLPPALAQSLRALANATRRHLFLENAVLLPLARARLTEADLDAMRSAMRQRRGLDDI